MTESGIRNCGNGMVSWRHGFTVNLNSSLTSCCALFEIKPTCIWAPGVIKPSKGNEIDLKTKLCSQFICRIHASYSMKASEVPTRSKLGLQRSAIFGLANTKKLNGVQTHIITWNKCVDIGWQQFCRTGF